jgi:hypothetical protein
VARKDASIEPALLTRFNEHYLSFLSRLHAQTSEFLASSSLDYDDVRLERCMVESMGEILGDGVVRELIREAVLRKFEKM